MDPIEKFAQWQASQKISYSVAAQLLNCDRGTLAQICKGDRKCPKPLESRVVRFIERLDK